ncbi:MAG: NAD(P)-dependent oxidoreductase [Acidobacteriota bacterium]|jgi:3-hydroxyisobutyrate dehydrogenase|nr:NAD(P)-dependent oxidoreductase [Acidobacteriota bacterium]
MKSPVTLLGAGLLGTATAERLLELEYPLTVFNRSEEKTRGLKRKGAKIASSAEAAVVATHRIILMLTDFPAISEVLDEVPPDALRGRAIIQMGTISPDQSRSLAERVGASGGEYLEAPVLGSRPEARKGRLQIMVGATADQCERHRDLLDDLGRSVTLFGEVGAASAVKLALNQLIVSLTAAFALSLAYVQKQALPVDAFMEILRDSALFAPTFDKKLKRMRERDFSNPNFPLRHLRKDLRLIMRDMKEKGLEVSCLESLDRLLSDGLNQGLGKQDYSAIYNIIHPQ